ncbi:ferric-dicitrate binding protein FerR (iron transport regulator) [Dyadobacter jejuensis]|uniref:Ferric-dicitrate binding protein FerR (Iron transport regulator) n=1 Tax=Dyadobacter jejuensis TaxID=1082580 RepID=A0A316AJ86_9BACT|nr:FecR domain-containing protein [Dyadobacter jejuensis]PWJ57756.1 ferric-dicitrate binding protein FerR (iron transport regulator) [Dyadobacter jejuensis]
MNIDDLYNSFGMEPPSEDDKAGEPLLEKENKIRTRIYHSLGWGRQQRPLRWVMISSAASVVLLVMVGLYWYFNTQGSSSDMVAVVVPAGHTQHITLPDGSEVWLNAASVFRYPTQFGDTREVYLEEGEGFFQIKRDTTAPFTVHSQHLNTKVLGTSFRVKAYKELSHEIVTVVSGKVSVYQGETALTVLEKDQEVKYSKISQAPVALEVSSEDAVNWTKGKIILKSVSFEDIIMAIENAYQVRIVYDHSNFQSCESSIHFSVDQPLEDVMDLLKDIQGIDYRIAGKEVMVTGKGCL